MARHSATPMHKLEAMAQPNSGLLLKVLLLACLACGTAAQGQASPLKGSGVPTNETTDIYVSCLLERLLQVNEAEYTHTTVLYFYITWRDPRAPEAIERNTAAMLNGSRTCQLPCSNLVDSYQCCDGFYVPSFAFRNALSYAEDRATNYRIAAQPDGSIYWHTQVQATFYQPFNFENFPFDSTDLIIDIEFIDTTPEDHAVGVKLHTSSTSTQLYSVGVGDVTSEWAIESLHLAVVLENASDTFKTASYSNWGDFLPLKPQPGAPGENVFAHEAREQEILQVTITIQRFWRYHLISSVLPVVFCAWLGFLVFFIETSQLAARLEVIVTLFLALAAVQFVISSGTVASSYVLPTQQLILASYALMALMAVESIVVYWMVTRLARLQQDRDRREAADRYRAWREEQRQLAAEEKEAAGGGGGCLPRTWCGKRRQKEQQAPERNDGEGLPTTAPPGFASGARRGASKGSPGDEDPPHASTPAGEAAAGAEGEAGELPQKPRPEILGKANSVRFGPIKLGRGITRTISSRLRWNTKATVPDQLERDHQAYLEWGSNLADNVIAIFLFFAYNLCALLIFLLQHGYVELLPPNEQLATWE